MRIVKKLKKILIGAVAVATLAGLSHLSEGINILENFNKEAKKSVVNQIDNTSNSEVSGVLTIDYIDVGQGDSALVNVNGKYMLIDAGTNASEKDLINYLKGKNIQKIDYVIGTHPHEDHIGGLDKVIDNFDIGQVYLPKISHTTKTYESVLESIKNKGLKVTTAKEGVKIDLGPGTTVEMYSPNKSKYDNLNDYSPIMRVVFGENKFLFTGDAEREAENEVIKKGVDLSADVLKVGHHGSDTSTSDDFLKKVNPKIAIISCGKGNDYGHPHNSTVNKLEGRNIKTFRTDEVGTIQVESDGKNLTVRE